MIASPGVSQELEEVENLEIQIVLLEAAKEKVSHLKNEIYQHSSCSVWFVQGNGDQLLSYTDFNYF